MKTDLSSLIKVVPSTAPAAAVTGNGTTTGATIDTQGYNSLTFVVQTGVVTDGTFAGKIYGDSAQGMGTEVELTGADLLGSNIAIAVSDDGVTERVGVNLARVQGSYRYFRLKLTQAGATTGGFICANAILGSPNVVPTSTP